LDKKALKLYNDFENNLELSDDKLKYLINYLIKNEENDRFLEILRKKDFIFNSLNKLNKNIFEYLIKLDNKVSKQKKQNIKKILLINIIKGFLNNDKKSNFKRTQDIEDIQKQYNNYIDLDYIKKIIYLIFKEIFNNYFKNKPSKENVEIILNSFDDKLSHVGIYIQDLDEIKSVIIICIINYVRVFQNNKIYKLIKCLDSKNRYEVYKTIIDMLKKKMITLRNSEYEKLFEILYQFDQIDKKETLKSDFLIFLLKNNIKIKYVELRLQKIEEKNLIEDKCYKFKLLLSAYLKYLINLVFTYLLI